ERGLEERPGPDLVAAEDQVAERHEAERREPRRLGQEAARLGQAARDRATADQHRRRETAAGTEDPDADAVLRRLPLPLRPLPAGPALLRTRHPRPTHSRTRRTWQDQAAPAP